MTRTALIVGAGSGISAAFARLLHSHGYPIDTCPLAVLRIFQALCAETKAKAIACDADRYKTQVDASIRRRSDRGLGRSRCRALQCELSHDAVRSPSSIPKEVKKIAGWSAPSADFSSARRAARRMLKEWQWRRSSFTGASASIRGFADPAPFAMGKFALRGPCTIQARELHPQGRACRRISSSMAACATSSADGSKSQASRQDSMLDPHAIARNRSGRGGY